jgi:glucokinase
MILAGDVGGTKTLIGLFEVDAHRPAAVDVRTFSTTQYPGLPAIIDAFLEQQPTRPAITTAAFGVAGPVVNQFAQMTNVEWGVDAAEIARAFNLSQVHLLNDLEAMAHSVPVLAASELKTLQGRHRPLEGNIAIIAAGTGLGEALLHYSNGGYLVIPSEGGHSDFAPRTDREFAFALFLRERYGRAEIEHVLSGPGLLNLSNFTHLDSACAAMAQGIPDTPPAVALAALAGTCPRCVEAMDLLVAAYGATAGNLALTAVTRGGVFVGGGVAPRILPALENGKFIQAFNDKGPMRPLLETIPVHVILNPHAALLGAAVCANREH